MNKLINGLNPAQILVVGFIIMILIGSILLAMPFSTETGESISYIDALFTATSAVCVTGLAVVDTGSTFNLFGEIVLLVLIQIGGLGFMTFGVLFALLLGKRINLRQRILIQESIKHFSLQGVVKLAQLIFLITIGVQVVGALLLSIRWIPEMGFGQGLYYSIFHSISAFNNAGFGLYPDSLMKYVADPIINITITLLLVIGGIGFSVIIDIFNKRSLRKLSLNTKMVLFTTLALSVIGFVILFILEIRNPLTLNPLDWDGRIWGAYFQSMVTRTAGFNSISIGDMYSTSLFIMIILMFIGASPGSTGGGIKTTTFMVLLASVWSTLKGREKTILFERTITNELIRRSLAIMVLGISTILFVTVILTLTEPTNDLMFILFEVTSAFATVGLSMGLTPDLTEIGKVLISITMFIGRLGPLTLGFALAYQVRKELYHYPEEKVLIG